MRGKRSVASEPSRITVRTITPPALSDTDSTRRRSESDWGRVSCSAVARAAKIRASRVAAESTQTGFASAALAELAPPPGSERDASSAVSQSFTS